MSRHSVGFHPVIISNQRSAVRGGKSKLGAVIVTQHPSRRSGLKLSGCQSGSVFTEAISYVTYVGKVKILQKQRLSTAKLFVSETLCQVGFWNIFFSILNDDFRERSKR